MPNGRCYYHGGATPVGPASPSWKTGRYSRYMPERLARRVHEMENDPDLLSLKSELALVQLRLSELLEGVGTAQNWTDLSVKWAEFVQALREQDSDRIAQLVTEINGIVRGGADDTETWKEITALLESRRRLAESEQKRIVAAQHTVAVDQAMGLLGILVEAVKEAALAHATPDVAGRILAATSREYQRIIGPPADN